MLYKKHIRMLYKNACNILRYSREKHTSKYWATRNTPIDWSPIIGVVYGSISHARTALVDGLSLFQLILSTKAVRLLAEYL